MWPISCARECREALFRAGQDLVLRNHFWNEKRKPLSPGLLYLHYSLRIATITWQSPLQCLYFNHFQSYCGGLIEGGRNAVRNAFDNTDVEDADNTLSTRSGAFNPDSDRYESILSVIVRYVMMSQISYN